MADYDPANVSIRQAATVMLVDDRPGLEILMMERHANTVFAGGMWVFPGGSVDPGDDPARYESITAKRSDHEASELMGLPHGGLTYYVTAIREAFEEAGILLAVDRKSGEPLTLTDPSTIDRFQAHRDALNDGSIELHDILGQEDLMLDGAAMHYIARWITPLGPPRRFDARFFIARIPRGQTPSHDDSELVHSSWLSPPTILERFDAEDMVLMSPTLRMIRSLAAFDGTDAVIASAAANLSDHRARVREDSEIVFPGDDGYEDGTDKVESGWVRLRPV
jgi:8-oxo-dGTP pyrophosphatase MutT (NUDIX family)